MLNRCLNSRFLIVKALVGTFNKEKALVGAFSGTVKFCEVPLTSSDPDIWPSGASPCPVKLWLNCPNCWLPPPVPRVRRWGRVTSGPPGILMADTADPATTQIFIYTDTTDNYWQATRGTQHGRAGEFTGQICRGFHIINLLSILCSVPALSV